MALTTTVIIGLGLLIYAILYFTYGKKLEKEVVKADPNRETPAKRLYDGIDYVPADRPVLFGHHFASIAGAAPIVGPVIAMAWGWLPGLAWIWFGNVLLGAVHDYLSLMASVRYDGRSIQWISGKVMSKRTSLMFQVFIYFVLILVVAAFAAVINSIFVKTPQVATASILFIASALVVGFLMYRTRIGIIPSTAVGLALLLISIWLGFQYPLSLTADTWYVILFVYIIVAASLPVWVLLQPRDYLNAWILWFGLIAGGVALLIVNKEITWPAYTTFSATVVGGKASPFWPVVPLVIACGSLSGFHSIVASGTTSKQLANELHGLTIGYGGMLTEGFLSTLVVTSIAAYGMSLLSQAASKLAEVGIEVAKLSDPTYLGTAYITAMLKSFGKVGIFAQSYGMSWFDAFGVDVKIGTVFAGLWVSAFALTTLDTTNRLARFTWSEIVAEVVKDESARRVLSNRWLASLLAAAIGIGLAKTGNWTIIWPAFGGANQMLAAIALMTSGLWVRNVLAVKGVMRYLVLAPALFLWLTVTLAYVWFIVVVKPSSAVYTIVVIELLLAFMLFYEFGRAVKREVAVPA
ncbi:carbon starvation protein A [Ferroglobus sp.]|uniref:carbon starvation CstA family protein n=1 Tax=Ferroglobus sp. TaxID=2614230 RepID=UPI0025BC6E31|nr:carbon starvation protein A [Ferroglobus sp.]